MPMDVATHQALGLDQPTPVEANGRSNADILEAIGHAGDAAYHPCPEAHPAEDVPRGEVLSYRDWDGARVFPNTIRDLFLYRGAAAASGGAVNLMIFQDGAGYLHRKGPVRAAAVLDSLQASGEIPATAAIFVNPGRPPGTEPMGTTFLPSDEARTQRSLEYDSLTADYGRFLLEDVLPFAASELGLRFTSEPTQRIVCGISSGGICAFTVAWHHPGEFQRVLSHCGSFTNIRGGHNYPYLIRSTPRKPLRVYLQSGENDAGTLFGDWPLANRTMANAFRYAGYDHHFEFGTGGHSLRHGGATFADSIRWLWRDDTAQAEAQEETEPTRD